jgi:hypothetical protein
MAFCRADSQHYPKDARFMATFRATPTSNRFLSSSGAVILAMRSRASPPDHSFQAAMQPPFKLLRDLLSKVDTRAVSWAQISPRVLLAYTMLREDNFVLSGRFPPIR